MRGLAGPAWRRLRAPGRRLVCICLIVMLLLAGCGGDKRPNIVLIMADDLGYESCGANGGTSCSTPVLDRLAAGGMRFEHCYSQPLCTPSRVQIMTGIYNVRNYVGFAEIDPGQTTFAHLLRSAGYATCVAGKWQVGGGLAAPGHFGFDEYCLWNLTRRPSRYVNPGLEINGEVLNFRDGEYGPDLVIDYICDFIERKKNQSFLVYYPMILPHWPFAPTPDSEEWNPRIRGGHGKGDQKYHQGMVAYMDKLVGTIVAKLDELGLRENTLVLFTGDNGNEQGLSSGIDGGEVIGGKGKTTDQGTHVPLIANWPGMIPAGVVLPDLVDFSDFLPTICEAAGVTVPQDLEIDGRSFMPQLRAEDGVPRRWIYSWFSQHGSLPATEFARNQRYKLYRTGEFYDISRDPTEEQPIDAGTLDSETAAVKKMLREALEQYKDARPEELRSISVR